MEDLLDNFELLFKARGMSALHGRVFGTLLISDKALSQEEIAEKTGYSIPAISIALDELSRLRLIRKERKSGDRKYYYSTDAKLSQIFYSFLESIHDEHVVPFLRALRSKKQKNKNVEKFIESLEDLRQYLESLLEVSL